MGPGDPFASRGEPSQTGASTPNAAPSEAAEARLATPALALGLGSVIGVAIGAIGWFEGFGAAAAVASCGLLGMGVAWGIAGLTSGRLDWRGAVQALLRRSDLR